MPEPKSDQYAIPRLDKIKREGLSQTHAARAENRVTPPHVIPGAPAPEVIFNAAPRGVDFKAFVLSRYERAINEGIVYRPRRDQVLAIEGMLSASPEFFRPDEPGKAGAYMPQRVKVLRERGLKFLHDQYGDQLIRAELQLDEVTPHIQFAFFPIDKRGRWSAKNCTTRGLLSVLWTRWAKVMADVGLRRGIAGSQAKHEPISKYYAAISRFDEASVKAAETFAIVPPELPVPPRSRLLNPSDYIKGVNDELAAWGRKETNRILKMLEPLIAASADAVLTRRRAKQMRQTAEQQAGKITTMEANLGKQARQLARLEPISVAKVADKIGYGKGLDLKPYRDALMFLEQLEGLDMDQSIGWLRAEFGPEAAAATAADLVRANTLAEAATPEHPKIQTIDELKATLKAQLSVLDAEGFQILSAKRGEQSPKMVELLAPRTKSKSWAIDDVVSAVIGLKRRAADHEIRMVPVSRPYRYLRIAGLKSPAALTGAGFHPCSIVRVGPDQYEATLRVPKEMEAAEANKANRALRALHAVAIHEVGHQAPLHLAGLRSKDAQSLAAVELVLAEDVDFLAPSNSRPGSGHTPSMI